ncbi:MAG: hypothetical protein HS126_21530 [Anaerolineales bacterium]|nr:hypothetical protein [Anaerolineales bacterium]
MKKSQQQWSEAANFACEIIAIEFLRDRIDIMKQWVNHLDAVVEQITKLLSKLRLRLDIIVQKDYGNFRDGYIDEAAEYLSKANEEYKNLKDERAQLQVLNELGTLEIRRLNFKDAKDILMRLWKLRRK